MGKHKYFQQQGAKPKVILVDNQSELGVSYERVNVYYICYCPDNIQMQIWQICSRKKNILRDREQRFLLCGSAVELQQSLSKRNVVSARRLRALVCLHANIKQEQKVAESSHKPLNLHLTARCPELSQRRQRFLPFIVLQDKTTQQALPPQATFIFCHLFSDRETERERVKDFPRCNKT